MAHSKQKLLDSGANIILIDVNNKDVQQQKPHRQLIGIAENGKQMVSNAKGILRTNFKNHENEIEVWLTKNNRYDLFSVYKLIQSCKLDGIFFDEQYAYILKKVKLNNKNYYQIEEKIAAAENGIYPLFNENFTKKVKNKNVLDTALKNWQKKYENIGCVTSSYTPKYEILVHRRLGCLSKSYMLEAVRHKSIRGLEKLDKKKIEECIGVGSGLPCMGCQAKANAHVLSRRTRGQANDSTYRNIPKSLPMQTEIDIATDTFGPFTPNYQGIRYAQIFINTSSRMAWLYPMRARSEYPFALKQFLLDYKSNYPSKTRPVIYQSDYQTTFQGTVDGKIDIIRSDRAPELSSEEVNLILSDYDIKHLKTIAYTSIMNGTAERAIQTLNKIAISQLANANLTTEEYKLCYWKSLKHAVHVYNIRPHRSLGYQTPYYAQTGVIPHIDWIRTWGSTAFEHLKIQQRPDGKRSRRFRIGIYVGMQMTTDDDHPACQIYIPSLESTFIRRSVILDETLSHDKKRIEQLRNGSHYINFPMNEHNEINVPQVPPLFAGEQDSDHQEFLPDDDVANNDDVALKLNINTDNLETVSDGKEKVQEEPEEEKTNIYYGRTRGTTKNQNVSVSNLIYNYLKTWPKIKMAKDEFNNFKDEKNEILDHDRGRGIACFCKRCVDENNKNKNKNKKFPPKLKPKRIKFIDQNEDSIEVEVNTKWFANLVKKARSKNKSKKIRKKKIIDRPTKLTPSVKLSDWDNPDVAWAMVRDDWPQWKEAIEKEFSQLVKRGTWVEIKRDEAPSKPLTTKMVLKIKRTPTGKIDKFKARLTVRGFLERFGYDYVQTSSPVTVYATLKFLVAHAVQNDRKLKLIDFAGAFLYPKLEEKICIEAPHLFGKLGAVLLLKKSLYGLKQASHEWHKALTKALKEIGFTQQPDEIDPCLFYHEKLDIYICTHVDDCFVSYTDEKNLDKVIKELTKKQFEMSTVEKFTKGLGLQFVRDKNNVVISQPNYVDFILKEFDLEDIKPANTPITSWMLPRVKGEAAFDQTKFRSLSGCLSHLARMTRPDILLAVFHLSSFCANPTYRHYEALIRICRYLKATKNKGIRFNKMQDIDNLFTFYVDTDWAGDLATRKSTTGYLLTFCGGPLVAKSRRQRNVTLSSTEAEYCAFVDAAKDILWVESLAKVFKVQFKRPAVLYNDNTTAQSMAEDAVQIKRMKHIDAFQKHIGVKYHYIRELVKYGIIKLVHIKSSDNLADLMTKPLGGNIHATLTKRCMNMKEWNEVMTAIQVEIGL